MIYIYLQANIQIHVLTEKGNRFSLEPNRAVHLSALLLRSLSEFADCRQEDDEGRLCSSHKILPPEGKVGGQQREVENLEPSGEDSHGAF